MTQPLLKIENLVTTFRTPSGVIKAVDDVSLSIPKGGTVALVGESGCGKSVLSMSIMRLIASPPGKIESGSIHFDGADLLTLSEATMRKVRGNQISMIFQEPMTSLNPVFTIGDQIAEVYRIHQALSKKESWERAVEMLRLVRIPAPEKRAHEYPHQLSGGMRQRVMIAIALACRPKLLIADEPTTALDVTIQAQILELMQSLQEELNMSILLITHDLGVVAEFCKDVYVMYAGKIVESANVKEIFENPQHPYTKGLLNAIPKLGVKQDRLQTIEGMVPSLAKLPVGCRFQERCSKVHDTCCKEEPQLKERKAQHQVSCWLNA